MKTSTAMTALFLSTTLLQAQSPCSPPSHLGTQDPFQSTHYYGAVGQNNAVVPPIPQAQPLPPGYRGAILFADLTADANLSVTQIDTRLNDDGSSRYNWGTAPGVAGPPGLVGQNAVVNVYSTPTTWTGTWPTPNGPNPTEPKAIVPPGPGSPWTLVATGTLTVQPLLQHSPIAFSQPFVVPAGTHGFAIELCPVTAPVAGLLSYQQPPYCLHPSLMVSASAPGAPLTSSDQFLTITNSDITNQAFVTAPNAAAKTPLLDFHYTVPTNSGYFARTGSGCYDAPSSIYEVFPSATFDLSNTGFQLAPVGTAYAVTACPSTLVAPTTPPLTDSSGVQLGDDSRTLALPLGFTFPYPGGSTTSIVVTSNGNIFLNPPNSGSQTATFEVFGVSGFLRGQPQLAPLWTDLDPGLTNGSGSVHLVLVPTLQVAYVTWQNVQTWNQPGSSNTVQVAMYSTGVVEYRYGACNITGVDALVGFNPGWSTHDPGPRDLSTALPFVTGDGAVPPDLSMDARPVIGTAPNFVIRDTPAGPGFGVLLLGNAMSPLDLGIVGMPSCLQQVQPFVSLVFLTGPGPTTGTVPLTIPNNPLLAGLQFTGQSLVLSPNSNAAGFTVSNPICIHLGR